MQIQVIQVVDILMCFCKGMVLWVGQTYIFFMPTSKEDWRSSSSSFSSSYFCTSKLHFFCVFCKIEFLPIFLLL